MDNIFELAQSVSIEKVIDKYVPLTKKGSHYLGICPFHNDKKLGSFFVTPGKGVFKCFSCGAYGDAIKFVSHFSNISSEAAAIRICEENGLITIQEAEEYRQKLSAGKNYANKGQKNKPPRKKPELKLSQKHDAVFIDKVYTAFYNAAGGSNCLTEEFRRILLKERRLTEEDLKDFFVYPSSRSKEFWAKFRYELNRLTGIESHAEQNKALLGVPGFYSNSKGKTTFMHASKACLGIRIKNRDNLFSGIQLRIMEPLEEGEQRYRFMSSGFADGVDTACTCGCGCGFVEDILFPRGKKWCGYIAVTEGRFKAITLSKMGFFVVNMHSISNWSIAGDVVLDIVREKLPVTKGYMLVYDQEDNEATTRSQKNLAEKLCEREVSLAVWDKQYGKGIDDVVNAGYFDKVTHQAFEK